MIRFVLVALSLFAIAASQAVECNTTTIATTAVPDEFCVFTCDVAHAFWFESWQSLNVAGAQGVDRRFWEFTNDGTIQNRLTIECLENGIGTLRGRIKPVNDNSNNPWLFDVIFTFAFLTDSGSPVLELRPDAYTVNGGFVDPSTWQFFVAPTGIAVVDGIAIAPPGTPLSGARVIFRAQGNGQPIHDVQLGIGANNKNTRVGLSTWISWVVTSQPTTLAVNLPNSNNQRGDINVNLTPLTNFTTPTMVPTAPPPTDAPTAPPPTEAPTDGPPTQPPTMMPTAPPTAPPPTEAPTDAPPTAPPTNAPTEAPTDAPPTEAPTDGPTDAPTDAPPTEPPTMMPTAPPTAPPPTEAPTDAPPTQPPTMMPTAPPTAPPPTEAPTDAPPTAPPTNTPTEAPTDAPPTEPPSMMPTAPPTDAPTDAPPTDAPTAAPTDSPTDAPPTDAPTDAPTNAPEGATEAPTAPPTDAPIGPPTTMAPTAPPTTAAPSTRAPARVPSSTFPPLMTRAPRPPPPKGWKKRGIEQTVEAPEDGIVLFTKEQSSSCFPEDALNTALDMVLASCNQLCQDELYCVSEYTRDSLLDDCAEFTSHISDFTCGPALSYKQTRYSLSCACKCRQCPL